MSNNQLEFDRLRELYLKSKQTPNAGLGKLKQWLWNEMVKLTKSNPQFQLPEQWHGEAK